MSITTNELLGIKKFDLTELDTVNAAAYKDIDLQPPEGTIYKIIDLRVHIPDGIGSSSGTHWLAGYHFGAVDYRDKLFNILSNFGNTIEVTTNGFGGDSESPSTQPEQLHFMFDGCLWANYDNPFLFRYSNALDVNQTGTRKLVLLVAVCKEAL